jgi:hypothetical protein
MTVPRVAVLDLNRNGWRHSEDDTRDVQPFEVDCITGVYLIVRALLNTQRQERDLQTVQQRGCSKEAGHILLGILHFWTGRFGHL